MAFAILGGGMGGLSAAHELVKRGFKVDVYERADAVGGKARSLGKPGSATGTRLPLPGEHGFRFFPGFYKHVIDTMQGIPLASGTVAHNLVETSTGAFAQVGKPLFEFPTVPPATTHAEWAAALPERFALPQLGLTFDDAVYFAGKLMQFAGSCDRRRNEQYELISWWDFLNADNRSPAFQKVLASGMTRSLVAMKPREASTRTIGKILLQMIFTLTLQHRGMDRVLNAPTSDAWIEPWRQHLQASGLCTFHLGVEVDSFVFDGQKITGVNAHSAAGTQVITADQYIAALPVEVMAAVVAKTPPLLAAAPSLQHLKDLQVDWMNGIQYYLGTDIPYVHGHIIALDSSWALTCISQPQFWNGVNMADYGDGTVKGLLSVDISDWKADGQYIHLKPAEDCADGDEVAAECWAQLLKHFAGTATPLPAQPLSWFLDPSIEFSHPSMRGVMPVASFLKAQYQIAPPKAGAPQAAPTTHNIEPLLINTTNSLRYRPEAATAIPNLFLASDYVRTYTDLACMEGANEAGRRAVNAFLNATNSTQARCMVQDLEEPAFLDPLKLYDHIIYGSGLLPQVPPPIASPSSPAPTQGQ